MHCNTRKNIQHYWSSKKFKMHPNEHHCKNIKFPKVKKINNWKCWQACEPTEIIINWLCEYKMM